MEKSIYFKTEIQSLFDSGYLPLPVMSTVKWKTADVQESKIK